MPTFKPQYKDKNGIIQDLNIDYNSLANKPTTKNEIESLKSNINTLDKRVTSIESRLSDRIFKVDSDLAYTKNVPAGALPYASIDTLGGMSYKYNQLVDKSKLLVTETIRGVTFTNNGDGSITVNGTATAHSNANVTTINIIANHKYLISNYGVKLPLSTSSVMNVQVYGANVINIGIQETDTSNYNIGTASGSGEALFRIRIENGASYNYTVYPMLVDLTVMYGAGKEPTTVEQFLADNPMYNDYVPYTEGDIANANVTSIDSVGVNIWDEEWEVGGYWTDGTKNNTVNNGIRNKTPIKVIPNQTYYIYFGNTALVGLYIHFYDKDMIKIGSHWNYQDKKNSTINVPSNCHYMNIFAPSYGTTYNNNICINVSNDDINGTYFPYNHNNFPIPSSIQELEGYGWGVNDSCYNYIDFENKKFVKRVGRVDLGTLNWAYYTGDGDNIFYVSNENIPSNFKQSGQIICGKYETRHTANVVPGYTEKVLVGWDTYHSQNLVVRDSTYTDATTFKTAMSGVYLYYELATPVITDISNILTDDNFIKVEPYGTLTFENTNKKAVPSKIAYLVEVK